MGTAGDAFVYDDALRARLTANLARHDRLALAHDGDRHAAVCVIVVDSDAVAHGADHDPALPDRLGGIPGAEDYPLTGSVAGTAGGPAVLLTRRAATLRSHGGQWALPGGRLDDGEDAFAAAVREAREEIGLELGRHDLLGVLDDYRTRSGYVITPFVFWGGADPALAPDPAEVRSVHRIGFGELTRSDSPRFVTIPESPRPVVQVPVGGDLIHAPTGAVVLQFRWVAIDGRFGEASRVAEFEQPVFAWR